MAPSIRESLQSRIVAAITTTQQTAQGNVIALVTAAVAIVLVFAAIISVVRSSWEPRNAIVAGALARARRLDQVWLQLGMQSKVKQAIGLYQGACLASYGAAHAQAREHTFEHNLA
eukprot:1825489-Pleurochrysis_carterae.AAC.2